MTSTELERIRFLIVYSTPDVHNIICTEVTLNQCQWFDLCVCVFVCKTVVIKENTSHEFERK